MDFKSNQVPNQNVPFICKATRFQNATRRANIWISYQICLRLIHLRLLDFILMLISLIKARRQNEFSIQSYRYYSWLMRHDDITTQNVNSMHSRCAFSSFPPSSTFFPFEYSDSSIVFLSKRLVTVRGEIWVVYHFNHFCYRIFNVDLNQAEVNIWNRKWGDNWNCSTYSS